MGTLKNRRTIESGRIWNAYFAAARNGELGTYPITKGRAFGAGTYTEDHVVFYWGDKMYAILSESHYNGEVFFLKIAQVV